MLIKQRLTDQVYEYLKKRITDLSLKPGEKIDIRKLADQLKISPTPVREAIHKLMEQGLVISRPYAGYFVIRLSPRDVEELFDLRKALEFLALEYVLQNPNKEFIDKLIEEVEALISIDDTLKLVDGVRSFDEEFHLRFLIEGSGNRWLVKVANGIIDLVKMTTRLTMNPRAACREHRDILKAIKDENGQRARQLLDAHLERSKEEAKRMVETGMVR